MIAIVMGVVGAGKTTVGSLLAQKTGWEFVDGDSFHSAANVEKMRQGIPLTDADRASWLGAIHDAVVQWIAEGRNVVLACSALKRSYREKIGIRPEVRFVYLKGSREVIGQRLRARRGHYATEQLLDSQFAILEEPEGAITVDVSLPPKEMVARIKRELGLV